MTIRNLAVYVRTKGELVTVNNWCEGFNDPMYYNYDEETVIPSIHDDFYDSHPFLKKNVAISFDIGKESKKDFQFDWHLSHATPPSIVESLEDCCELIEFKSFAKRFLPNRGMDYYNGLKKYRLKEKK